MKKWRVFLSVLVLLSLFLTVAVRAEGDVADVIENTWDSAKTQIKDVVNHVVFPIMDLVLAVLFFLKVAMAYLDYRKHGQLDLTAPAILFVTLVFSLTAPAFLWQILGM